MLNTRRNKEKMRRVGMYLYVTLSLLFAHLNCLAASFDCAKARGYPETAICNDAALSVLDDELGLAYLQQRHMNSAAQSQQKYWLTETRNQCRSVECLKRAYQERLSELRKNSNCPLGETDIIGHWVREKFGFFDEMEFSISNGERYFFSWIHHSPEISGRWSLKECVIRIDTGSAVYFSFTPTQVKNNRMFMIDDDNTPVIYRKIK